MKVKPFFIKVITPLHAGSGSDLGVVDMPIQRESHTSFPKIEASSLKGAIRSAFTDHHSEDVAKEIFGTDDKSGALGFSDARILFFPVKSVKGVFAYVTCPMVLNRFEADMKLGNEAGKELRFPQSIADNQCIVLEKNKNSIDNKSVVSVVLEEYSFKVAENFGEAKASLPKEIDDTVYERLAIISDDNFTHFVKNSTEVITRIRIGENGVVAKGGLFTEEYLPAESIMYALAIGDTEILINDIANTMQIGGNSTLGKGIVELIISIQEKVCS